MRSWFLWIAWIIVAGGLSSALAWSLRDGPRQVYLPGDASDGHYQIVDRCEVCHTPLDGVRQDACLACHADELDVADDSHPPAKFADPRNADRVAALDARRCITCHTEHRPARTDRGGVSLPADFCRACHADIAEQRPSHAGLAFDGCQAAGCHNFHDNRALTQEHVAAHLDEPWLLDRPRPDRQPWSLEAAAPPWRQLTETDVAAPSFARSDAIEAAWSASAHAATGVGCGACHAQGSLWVERPGQEACETCHDAQTERYQLGRHGMRRAAELPRLRTAEARLPMAADAPAHAPGCASCHDPHGLDRHRAAAEACLACHADEHSLAWSASGHAALWRSEAVGWAEPGSGVACATCHMPTVAGVTEHNQSQTLRPVENMIRPVCQQCHGLAFTFDALADPGLAGRCYGGAPARGVATPAMVRSHLRRKR